LKLSVIAAGRLKPGPEKALADDHPDACGGSSPQCGITRLAVTEFDEIPASSAAAHGGERGSSPGAGPQMLHHRAG
jgi:hypothetical protein